MEPPPAAFQASTGVTPEAAAWSVASVAPVTSGLPKPVTNGIAAAASPIETVPSTPQKLSPFLAEGGERPAAGGQELYEGSAAGTTVLVVDDDFRNIFALTALLERASVNVVAAESGADALAVLDQGRAVDIVLMDIMMPGMDGYETIDAIRKRPQLANLPIIAVTGKVVGGERARCLAAGASDYVPKPVDTAQLLTALSRWFPATPRTQVPPP